MEEETESLSEKRRNSFEDIDRLRNTDGIAWYEDDDVREAVGRLKKDLSGFGEYHGVEVLRIIDEIFGDKLV